MDRSADGGEEAERGAGEVGGADVCHSDLGAEQDERNARGQLSKDQIQYLGQDYRDQPATWPLAAIERIS